MTDKAFREFIQTLPSCLTGVFSEYLEDGRRLCVAAHVRRAGKSGTAYKADYSVIPMTQTEHLYQHQFGELACLLKFTKDKQLKMTLLNASPIEAERVAGEWFDAQVIRFREMWRKRTGTAPWEAEELANTTT
jgi:hypothetical protein